MPDQFFLNWFTPFRKIILALWYFAWKRTKLQKRILILKSLPFQILIKMPIFTANTKEPLFF